MSGGRLKRVGGRWQEEAELGFTPSAVAGLLVTCADTASKGTFGAPLSTGPFAYLNRWLLLIPPRGTDRGGSTNALLPAVYAKANRTPKSRPNFNAYSHTALTVPCRLEISTGMRKPLCIASLVFPHLRHIQLAEFSGIRQSARALLT